VEREERQEARRSCFLGIGEKAETKILGMNAFISAFALATLLVLIRSVFRVAELAHGFQGKLLNDQIAFMVLEGGVMVLAISIMTAFQPGRFLGGRELGGRAGRERGRKKALISFLCGRFIVMRLERMKACIVLEEGGNGTQLRHEDESTGCRTASDGEVTFDTHHFHQWRLRISYNIRKFPSQ